jgi:PAS domain S-box-containing protein
MEAHQIAEQIFPAMQPGDHLCCVYENESQQAQTIAQFVGEGLRQGQKVLYLFGEQNPEAILNLLQNAGVDCHDALARGQFVWVPPSLDTYLHDGSYDLEEMLGLISRMVEEAIAQGYPVLRATGEMSWLSQCVGGLETIMEYEARLNELPFASQAIFLCQYHRFSTDPQILYDMLMTHPKIMVGATVYENFYYLPVKTPLSKDDLTARFDLLLNNLTRRRQMEWDREQAHLDLSRQHLEVMVEQRTAQLQLEIHERQMVEKVLRESEGRYRALVNQAPLSIMVVQDNHYVFANPPIVQRLGYASAYELIGKNILDTISPESRDMFLSRQENILRGESGEPVVTAFLCKDGSVYYSENSAVAIFYQGRPAMLVIGQDVTDRLRYEQQLMSSLSEKEVMLREIHHRVKNNLNVIIALIDLQKAGQNDPQVLQVFNELQTRIYSMALVHENLFRSPNMASTDFAGYLQSLVSYLYSGYGPGPGAPGVPPVRLQVEADDVPLRVETAIPCGLIVNELMTNALKYAFPKETACGDAPERLISIRLKHVPGLNGGNGHCAQSESRLVLTVSDNGIGFPDGFNWRTTSTLGLQLVQVLARQLNAQISLGPQPGVTWNLTFTDRKQG